MEKIIDLCAVKTGGGVHMDNLKVESAVIKMNNVSVMLDMMNETCIDGREIGEKAEAAFLILKDLFDSCYSELRAAIYE